MTRIFNKLCSSTFCIEATLILDNKLNNIDELRGLTLQSYTDSKLFLHCQKIVFWSFVIPKEITFIYQRFVQQNKFSLPQYKKSFSVKPAFYFLTTEHKFNLLLLIVFLFCNIYIKRNLRIPF